MNTNDIQKRLDAIPAKLTKKGIVNPTVEFRLNANAEPSVFACWYDGAGYTLFRTKHCKGNTPEAALIAAEEWALSLPSIEEANMRNFMDALGNVIDMGRQNGIEVAFINPLTETMKKLSENALTYQRQAAE